MSPKNPFRSLFIFAINILLCIQAFASDQRLHGFWIRTNEGVPAKRWNLSANGTGTHETDFGPPYPGFVLTSYFTWTTNAAKNIFTYKVSRQTATGNGPYNYDEPVNPAKSYSEPYTLTGTTNKLWAYEAYTYAQAASLTEGNSVGPGTLDTSFNETGLVSFENYGGTGGYGGAVVGAVQPADGKILVTSNYTDVAGFSRSYLSRYDIGGTLDKTFNQTGTSLIDFGRSYVTAEAMAVDPQTKKIVVAGTSYIDGSVSYPVIDAILSRHTPAGAFDTTFNSTGKVINVGTKSLNINGVAIQPSDGKIVVVGSSAIDQNSGEMLVLRYLTNGQLDTTFNGTGRAATVPGGGALCVAIQPADGKIVVGGTSPGSGYTLFRFNTNGTLDTTFNPGGPEPGKFVSGSYTYNSDTRPPSLVSLAIRPSDGKIISGGYIYFFNGVKFLILCSNNSDGTPDYTFNGTGRVVESVSTGFDKGVGGSRFTRHYGSADQLAIQPDGKILVSGLTIVGDYWPNTMKKTAVLRYDLNGSLDPTFNGTGKVFLGVSEGLGRLNTTGLLVQPADGKIVVFDSENMIRLHGRDYTPPTKKKYHTVTVARVLAAKGTVAGTGGYAAGTKVVLKANAKKSYRFLGWKEKGKWVNKKSPYSFVLKANRELVAVFEKS